MNHMHGGIERDALNTVMENWKRKVRVHIKKIKVNPLDETETDFVDVDMIMRYYLEEYRNLR